MSTNHEYMAREKLVEEMNNLLDAEARFNRTEKEFLYFIKDTYGTSNVVLATHMKCGDITGNYFCILVNGHCIFCSPKHNPEMLRRGIS